MSLDLPVDRPLVATSITCAVVFGITLHFALLMVAAKRSAKDMTGRRLMRRARPSDEDRYRCRRLVACEAEGRVWSGTLVDASPATGKWTGKCVDAYPGGAAACSSIFSGPCR